VAAARLLDSSLASQVGDDPLDRADRNPSAQARYEESILLGVSDGGAMLEPPRQQSRNLRAEGEIGHRATFAANADQYFLFNVHLN
jgi:hypothetical protein